MRMARERATQFLAQYSHAKSGAVTQTAERRHELDWLRVLVIVGLIPFHVIGLFTISINTYITGGQINRLAEIVSNFFGLWPMSLLFLVAGASTWFALGRRTPRQYVRERLLRLFVPFLFATLVIIPIQVHAVVDAYPQLINMNLALDVGLRGGESFIEFYPAYLKGYAYFLTHFSSMLEIVFWGHIWFIPRLLLYALAAAPLLLWLRGEAGKRFTEHVTDLLMWSGGVLFFGLAIAIPRIFAAALFRLARTSSKDVQWDGYNLLAQLGVFLMFFLIGYIFYASPRLLSAVKRDGPIALVLGIISFALLQTPLGNIASVRQITPGGILITCLRTESEWLLVVGVLSVGLHFFTNSNELLQYLNDAAYPLYVLHMPVLIVIGLGIMSWQLPNIIALTMIVIATLVVTLGLYEYVIKRIAVLRMLFGLKTRHATSKPIAR